MPRSGGRVKGTCVGQSDGHIITPGLRGARGRRVQLQPREGSLTDAGVISLPRYRERAEEWNSDLTCFSLPTG